MPRTNSPKREAVIRLRVAPSIAARLRADADRLGRPIADVASWRLSEHYAKDDTAPSLAVAAAL